MNRERQTEKKHKRRNLNRERRTEKKHKRRQMNKQTMKQCEDTNKTANSKKKRNQNSLQGLRKIIQEEGVKVPSEAFFTVHSASNKVQHTIHTITKVEQMSFKIIKDVSHLTCFQTQ